MKTCLTFGFLMALAGFVLLLALYLAGLHSDADKLHLALQIGKAGNLLIAAVLLSLGIRARRSERPVDQAFTYGQAAGAGTAIAWWAAAFGMIGTYLYFGVIDPHFNELLVRAQLDKAAALGMNDVQLDRVERVARWLARPGVETVYAFILGGAVGTVIALIVAAFFRRPAAPLQESSRGAGAPN